MGKEIKRSYQILIQDRIGLYTINTAYFETSKRLLKEHKVLCSLLEKAEAEILNNYKKSTEYTSDNIKFIEVKGIDELPSEIREECFKRHTHGDMIEDEEIVYKESDVIAILNMALGG